MGKQNIFKYKIIKGPLHRVPAIIKLLTLLLISVFCMPLPSFYMSAGIFILIITACVCKLTLKEQLTDFKPALIYALLMYALWVFSFLIDNYGTMPHKELILRSIRGNPELWHLTLRLVLIIQLSSLLFRTTSSLEIRECLVTIEQKIRGILKLFPVIGKYISMQCKFAESISLFLSFIPEIFINWAIINLAYKARAGKQGVIKIKTIIFILIIICMERASLKAKALAARS